MIDDGRLDKRALCERECEEIQRNIYRGCYHDKEIDRLFESIIIQRQVLRELFDLFKREPLRRVSTAEPVPNSQLTHLKELVAMEDKPVRPPSF